MRREVLDKLLPRLRAQKSRMLLFSQSVQTLSLLEEYCDLRNVAARLRTPFLATFVTRPIPQKSAS